MLECWRSRLPSGPNVRNLLLLILVVFGIWWARGAWRRIKARASLGRKAEDGRLGKPEPMLECRHCGLIVPESEGVRAGEDFYCCDAHRRAGQRTD